MAHGLACGLAGDGRDGELAEDVKAAEGCGGVRDGTVECLVCGKTFPSRSQLFKHLKKVGCGGENGADVPRPHAEGKEKVTQGPDIKAQRKATTKAKRPPPTISDAAVTLVAPAHVPAGALHISGALSDWSLAWHSGLAIFRRSWRLASGSARSCTRPSHAACRRRM